MSIPFAAVNASRCTVVRESSLMPACVVPLKLSWPVIVPPASGSFAARSVVRLVTCDCARVSGSLPALACVDAWAAGVPLFTHAPASYFCTVAVVVL